MKPLVVLVAIVLGVASCQSHRQTATYKEPRDGWSVAYPASMNVHAIGYAKGMLLARGAAIASSREVRATQELSFRRFPANAVAFGLVRYFGGPTQEPSARETPLPLEQSRFLPIRGAPPPKVLEQPMSADGVTWHVLVWFGPRASDEDKDAVWRIVRSIRMPGQLQTPGD